MKRLLSGSLLLVLLVSSCSQTQEAAAPEPVAEAKQEKVIHFTTRAMATRTTFGESVTDSEGNITYPCYWTSNDNQVKISLNYEYAVVAGVNSEETDDQGHITRSSFDASFDGVDTSNPYTFFLVSPADAFLWASPERSSVSVSISSGQTPSKASVDEKAQILVAKSDSYDTLPSDVIVDFTHITSYGKLTLTNLDQNPAFPAEASLTSVTIISEEQPLTGSWYYSVADGKISEKEGSSSLVIDTRNIDVVAGDPIWFAAAPVSLAGKSITIKANFSDASCLERTIKLNDSFTLGSGKIKKFSVNMANATAGTNKVETSVATSEEVFQAVSSISDLSAGDVVIFMDSSDPGYAMTAAGTTSGIGAVAKSSSSFTVGSDGYVRLAAGTSVGQFTVGSRSNSTITFRYRSYYLGYTSSGSSRYLSLNSSSSSWTLTLGNSAQMYSGRGNSKYYFYCNKSSNNAVFTVSTTASSFAIFKKVTVESTESMLVDLSAAAIVNHCDYGAYLGTTNLVYNPSSDQVNREYGTDGTLTFTILDPANEQAVEFTGIPSDTKLGSSFTLGVKHIQGISIPLDKTFEVFVVKEEGHTLWLTDAEGNGFIVKR